MERPSESRGPNALRSGDEPQRTLPMSHVGVTRRIDYTKLTLVVWDLFLMFSTQIFRNLNISVLNSLGRVGLPVQRLP